MEGTGSRAISPSPWGQWRQAMDLAREAAAAFDRGGRDADAYESIKESLHILDALGDLRERGAREIAATFHRSAENDDADIAALLPGDIDEAGRAVERLCARAYLLGAVIAATNAGAHADLLRWAHRAAGEFLRLSLRGDGPAAEGWRRSLLLFTDGTVSFDTSDEYDQWRTEHLEWLESQRAAIRETPSEDAYHDHYTLIQSLAECLRRSPFPRHRAAALRLIARQGQRGMETAMTAQEREWARSGFLRPADRWTPEDGEDPRGTLPDRMWPNTTWTVGDDLGIRPAGDQRTCLRTAIQLIAEMGGDADGELLDEFDRACLSLLGSDYKEILAFNGAEPPDASRVVSAIDRRILVELKHAMGYESLQLATADAAPIRDALSSYAAGIDPDTVMAIDETAGRTWYRPQSQGVVFTDRLVCSSYLPAGSRTIPYIAIASTYHDVLRAEVRLRDGRVIDARFGPHTDSILDMLDRISRAMRAANAHDPTL